MTISQLIEKLKDIQEEYGDLKFVTREDKYPNIFENVELDDIEVYEFMKNYKKETTAALTINN